MQLEHANVCVHDVDGVVRFLMTAFPEFRVRHDATDPNGRRWVHVGNEETYVALDQAHEQEARRGPPYMGRPGLNHLGYEVDDVEAVAARLRAGGYTESTVENAHRYRKRIYFYDPDGNDWEFVQYLTDDPTKRNDYDLPDL